MMWCSVIYLCTLVVLVSQFSIVRGQGQTGEAPVIVSSETVMLEHNVGDGKFQPRGKFLINTTADGKRLIAEVDKAIIQEADGQDFRQLIKRQGHYQVRMKSSGDQFIYISIPVCALQASGFKEDILLYLSDKGHLLGATYQSPVIGLPRPCDASLIKIPTAFLTRIKIGDAQESMIVPLQATAPKPAVLGSVNLAPVDPASGKPVPGSDQPKAQEPSFFRKYWYIVLAMAVYSFLSPTPAPPAKKGTAPAKKQD
jgi:hypothetical protein